MSKLLYITANPKKQIDSISLTMGEMFINKYKALNPQDDVIEFDVYEKYVPIFDKSILENWNYIYDDNLEVEKQTKYKLDIIKNILNEFCNCDKFVIANPMWNMSIPCMLKAYLDCVVVINKSWKPSGGNNSIGLLENKKCLHISSSGSEFSVKGQEKPNYNDSYIKDIMKFIGITNFSSVLIEGTTKRNINLQELKDMAEIKLSNILNAF